MDENKIKLARRAVACPGWRWMRGMRVFDDAVPTVSGQIIDDDSGDRRGVLEDTAQFLTTWDMRGALPDLDDPATLGCLLALVREAICCSGETEADALVSVLEAAR